MTASEAFAHTPQLAGFLRFVVEAKLRGESDRIKQYTIAVDVFGRGEGFNPDRDPLVRVAGGRLRRALDRYYAAIGMSDPVLIEVPRGHYVPKFSYRRITTAARQTSILHSLRDARRWVSQRLSAVK